MYFNQSRNNLTTKNSNSYKFELSVNLSYCSLFHSYQYLCPIGYHVMNDYEAFSE